MTAPAQTLFDAVPGNIGLGVDHALFALRCDEPDGVLLSDEIGNLQDFQVDGATTAPVSESGWAGRARRFAQASSRALLSSDVTGRDTLSTRDMTVQAIVSLRLAGASGAMTLVARGVHSGSAAEALSFAIELQASGTPGSVDVRWLWEDYAGTIKTQTAGTYVHPGDDAFVLLTCTRRWEESNVVVLRYYAGETLLAEVTSTDGSIAGGTTGHTMVGGRKSGGAWSKYFNGAIDELVVTNHEMSADEVREVWRRLTVYQPGGVETFAGLAPPGAPWYRDPGNKIGRVVKVVGQMLGLAVAKNEELRALFLADRATLEVIGRWEKLCGLAPRPRDSLDARRARVVGYLSRLVGYSIPAIQQAESGLLDLAPADVQILEFTNRIDEPFTTLAPERWLVGTSGTWAAAAGVLGVTAAAGADLRWDPSLASCYVRTPLSSATGSSFLAGNVIFQAKLVDFFSAPALPVNTIVGLFLYNRRSNNALWFGVKNVAGTFQLGYVKNSNGVLGAFTVLATPANSAPYWLRVMRSTGGFGGSGSYVLAWSTTGPTTGFTSSTVALGFHDFEWAGFAAMSTDASLASNLSAKFDDATIITPNGDRPFYWYVYRDPGLPGSPDIIGAEALALRIRPAHTYVGVCQSKSVLCDDTRDGLCDRGPMGGL